MMKLVKVIPDNILFRKFPNYTLVQLKEIGLTVGDLFSIEIREDEHKLDYIFFVVNKKGSFPITKEQYDCFMPKIFLGITNYIIENKKWKNLKLTQTYSVYGYDKISGSLIIRNDVGKYLPYQTDYFYLEEPLINTIRKMIELKEKKEFTVQCIDPISFLKMGVMYNLYQNYLQIPNVITNFYIIENPLDKNVYGKFLKTRFRIPY